MYKLRVKQFEHIASVISQKMENIPVIWKKWAKYSAVK